MHGGAVGSVAERVAIACARTVVGEDKDIFLGELSNTYLSPAPCNVSLRASPVEFCILVLHSECNQMKSFSSIDYAYLLHSYHLTWDDSITQAEVVVDGSMIRSGRNLTVVAVDFRLKETGKLMYMSRATLYNTPVSGL